jgi:hypothetical protein
MNQNTLNASKSTERRPYQHSDLYAAQNALKTIGDQEAIVRRSAATSNLGRCSSPLHGQLGLKRRAKPAQGLAELACFV